MRLFARRLAFLLLGLAVIFTCTRAMVRALPGDPIETLIAESGTSIPEQALREEFRLDRPFLPALAEDVKSALRGDFGRSLFTREPIGPVLVTRFLKTLELALSVLAVGLAVSLLIGLPAAARPRSRADRFCSLYGGVSAALPTPWIGPMLMIAFGFWLPLFPITGHLALPTLTLALGFSGLWARLIRQRVRETLVTGAAVGARARGLPEWKVLLKYGLAPVSGALLAYLGTQFGALLAGAFVTEVIFNWKGMGSLLVDAVLRRDYPVIEAGTFITASACLLGNAAGDWLQQRIVKWDAAA